MSPRRRVLIGPSNSASPDPTLPLAAGALLLTILAYPALAQPKGPPNDDCANAIPINGCIQSATRFGLCEGNSSFFCTVTPDNCPPSIAPCIPHWGSSADCGTITVDNRLANRDGSLMVGGPSPESCDLAHPSSLQADVWYDFYPPSIGILDISNCEADQYFDTMVEIYNTCDCSQISTARRVACSNEGCADFFDNKRISGPTRLTLDVANPCYKIRIGGYAHSTSFVSGDIMKPDYGVTDFRFRFLSTSECFDAPPEPITSYPNAAHKQRYLTWKPGAAFGDSAYRVVHRASGRAYNVSTPRITPASIEGHGYAVLVSDPDPIYYDWSSLSQVHVTGCMISPGDQANSGGVGQVFEVHTMCGIFSVGFIEVSTAPRPTNGRWWADVVGSFAAGGDPGTAPPTPPNSWRPPDLAVSGFDIVATLQGAAAQSTAPHTTWTDVNPETPDRTTNGSDVLRIVNAFSIGSGREFYPFRVPQAPGDQGQLVCPLPPLMSQLPP